MQSLTSLLALLSLAAAESVTFSITDFNFTGTTGPNAIYSFYVSANDSVANPTLCYHTTPTHSSIGFFAETLCEEAPWTYSWDAFVPGSPDAGNAVNITCKQSTRGGKDLQARLVLSHDAVQTRMVGEAGVEYLNTGYGPDFDLTANEI